MLFAGRGIGLDAECLLPSRQRGFNARFLSGADGAPAGQPAAEPAGRAGLPPVRDGQQRGFLQFCTGGAVGFCRFRGFQRVFGHLLSAALDRRPGNVL